MKEEQVYERWREIFEELERGTDLDSQALFEQIMPCFYKTRLSEPLAGNAPPGGPISPASVPGSYPYVWRILYALEKACLP